MSVRDPLLADRLIRRRDGRWVAGVCNGLAAALGVPVGALRAVVVLLAFGSLPAVALLYGLAWAFLPPESEEAAADRASAGPAGPPGPAAGLTIGGRPADVVDAAAVLAVVAGAVLLLGQFTAWLPGQIVAPAVLATVGAGLAWGWGGRSRAGEPPSGAGSRRRERLRPLFVAVGVSLVLLGGLATLAAVGDLSSIGRSAAGAAVLTAGAILLFGPWMVRLARNLTDERRQRIRSEERAEMAAHLHDGVLQTLALIQKRAGDDKAVRSLARRQERELRSWLYGGRGSASAPGGHDGIGADLGGSRRPTGGTAPVPPSTLASLLQRELDEVEDNYGVRLDAVLVGDAPLDDAGRALVAAGREAALNAARHAGVDTVDVYLEVEPERVSLFVRDRGRGFDPAGVPTDRRGVADSIEARVRRHGGTAVVRSAPGEGAEVELSMPRAPARADERPR